MICYVMWFVIPLYEFDVLYADIVFHYMTLLLHYANCTLRFVHLSSHYVALLFAFVGLIHLCRVDSFTIPL